ncbi:MAG: heavy metal translocating P-type ATPase [Ruminococcaceae bacterium]|nr:heavy metal translocating P-type ATPase [Oscillospiraceae bacterium]
MKKYSVSGMSCAACVARVEQAVKKVDGVEECTVSLLTASMTVSGEYDEQALHRAVTRAGYGIADPAEEKKEVRKEPNQLLRLWSSVALLLALMTLSMGHMIGIRFPAAFPPVAQGTCQMLLSLSILLIHRRFFIGGFRSAVHLSPNMDTLVAMGSGVSFLYSLAVLAQMIGREDAHKSLHGLYFESAAMILVLISVGKLLEEKSRGKTTSAIRALQALAPQTARIVREDGEEVVSMDEVRVGDLIRVLPGDLFPVDGVIVEGVGAVDESALTGESLPVDKNAGDPVFTGTVNLNGSLAVRAEKVGGETTLSRMIDRVIAAGASKAPIARLADRVSGVFVPVILLLSLVVFGIWMIAGEAFGVALSRGIAVTVVSCPCALGLATPVAIMVANGVAARSGILFKTATALEEAGKTKIVVLDKTGTVTTGKMQVSDVIPWEISEHELLSLSCSLEEGSTHPIATAVVNFCREKSIASTSLTELTALAGFGVEGKRDGELLRLGKAELIGRSAHLPKEAEEKARLLSEEGKTVLHLSAGARYCGMIAVTDTVKTDSPEAIRELLKMGLRVVMITGDREETARSIAKTVKIDEVMAGVLPEGKEDAVRALEKEGRVLMVGDGINDAPALTAASVGVAIGSGTQIAVDAAEVVLMGDSLSHIPALIRISRKTLKNIKENLFWAFCYNIVGIPLAAGAFIPLWGWSLTPMFGAAAMSFSSLFVVGNALRLNRLNPKRKEKEKKSMKKTMKVEGMMCPHCEAHVKKALEALSGVEEAIPSHVKGEVVLKLSADVSDALLKETVEKEGYKVV